MNILHLDSEATWRGGQQQVHWLVQGLAERGHRQAVVGPKGSELLARVAKARLAGVTVHELGEGWLANVTRAGTLRGFAGGTGAQIVHAHAARAHAWALGAFAGVLPLVVTRRVDFPIKGNPLSRRKYTAGGQHFIAISEAIRNMLLAGGVRPERISLVPSGIDLARIADGCRERARVHLLGGRRGPLIGFVGALVDHKDPGLLLEAFRLLRGGDDPVGGGGDPVLVFVGDGELRARLEQTAEARGVSPVHFAGWRDDVPDCLASMELFVMPSREEGLCTSLLDAQAAGVPCVVTAAGGMVDIVRDGENGLVVPIGDAGALAAAMRRMLSDAELSRRCSERGREVVRERFTREAMAAGNEAVYEQVLAGAATGR